MRAKKKPVNDLPVRLASFDPAEWGSVLEWAQARREFFSRILVSDPARWLDGMEETHRVLGAVLRRGELV